MIGVIGFKEIYEAWELSYKDQIEYHGDENYDSMGPSLAKSVSSVNPKFAAESEKTNATKTDWLEEVPKVLCL